MYISIFMRMCEGAYTRRCGCVDYVISFYIYAESLRTLRGLSVTRRITRISGSDTRSRLLYVYWSLDDGHLLVD